MNNNNEAPNFLDRRTLTAIGLVVLTWVGWQAYMQAKYPHMFDKKAVTSESQPVSNSTTTPTEAAAPTANISNSATLPNSATIGSAVETFTDYQGNRLAFQISSRGMGIKSMKLLDYKDRKGQTVQFSDPTRTGDPRSFETRLLGSDGTIPFEVQTVSPTMWIGHAKIDGLEITKTMALDPDKNSFDVKVSAQGDSGKFAGLTTYLNDQVEPPKPTNFLNRSYYDRQEAFVDTSGSHNNHVYVTTDVIDKSWSGGRVVALGSNYFTQAILDRSSVMPEVKLHVSPITREFRAALQYDVLNKNGNFDIHFTGFAGPKNMDLLKSVDDELAPIIDLGFFSWIARYILALLKGFHSIVPNWGWDIILLTILVRLLVLPFNIISYRSMKTMQALQPQIKAMKERYKDDQQRANQEMMALFKTHKVNPAGGCLPMFLQLPIFWALYQVLGHSIELYQQPFFLWIHDLSLKDPLYVLPVLMGLTMFLQQLITPSPTMDPNQAKIMKFVPLIFSFFMISLPSGLTLYIWISSLFAVVQQYYFMKSHSPLVEAVP